MTFGQRKAHKLIWLLLLIIMPVVMFFAVKDLDFSSASNKKELQIETANEQNISVFENDIIKASLYKNSVEIILKSTLKSASSIVYEIDKEGNKLNTIGQLTTAGIYKFNINNLPKEVLVFDEIKKVIITKISF